MADASLTPTLDAAVRSERRSGTVPRLAELPKLTKLTLASAIGGGGGTGSGGSTVFGLLLALGVLAGCARNDALEPSAPAMPKPIASVECEADLAARSVSCGGGPAAAPGQKILGGQGTLVTLLSPLVVYNDNDSTFAFLVLLQNLTSQPIGLGASGPSGIRIFFEQLPTPHTGTGAITLIGDSIGTFTAAGQHYYVDPATILLPMDVGGNFLMKFHVPPTVLTFRFTVLVSTDVIEDGGPLKWRPVVGGSVDYYGAVAAGGPNEALAAGMYGHSSRWNGSEWRSLVPFTNAHVNAVASLGGGEYVAVTDGGEIWRLKGNLWMPVHVQSNGYDLTTVWAEDSGHFVAGGEEGAVVTYESGGVSEQVLSSAGDTVVAVTGKSDGSEVSVLLKSNTLFTNTGGGAFVQVAAITGVPGGIAYDGNDHLLWTYRDQGTMEVVFLLDGTEIHRAGPAFPNAELPVALTLFQGTTVLISYYDPVSYVGHVDQFSYATLPASITPLTGPVPHLIKGMALAGSTLLMSGLDRRLLRWDGSTVHEEQTPVGVLPEMWGIGDTAWIVTAGGGGGLGRIVDGALTRVGPFSSLDHITGVSSTEIYFSGVGSQLFRGDGGNSWVHEWTPLAGAITGLWGDPATGTLVVALDNGDLATRVGGSWNLHAGAIPAGATKVWGCSASSVWIVVGYRLWHWNGTTATEDLDYSTNAGSAAIHGIGGTSCANVWTVHEAGASSYDGTNWSNRHVAEHSAVIPWSPGTAWLLDGTIDNGRIERTFGLGWGVWIPTQHRQITAGWRLANGGLLVAGNSFILLGGE